MIFNLKTTIQGSLKPNKIELLHRIEIIEYSLIDRCKEIAFLKRTGQPYQAVENYCNNLKTELETLTNEFLF